MPEQVNSPVQQRSAEPGRKGRFRHVIGGWAIGLSMLFGAHAVADDILYLYGSVPPANAGHQLLLSDTGGLGFSQFRDAILDLGYSPVEVLDDNITLDGAVLDDYRVLVLSSNNRGFGPAEQQAVVDFVTAGGGLFVYSDSQFGFDEGRDSDNDILQHFNMMVMHDNFAGVFTISQYTQAHELTDGITFKGEGVSLVRVLGPPAVILADCQGGNCVLHPTDGPIQANDAALAVAEVGQGRVVVTFDRNTFFNPPGAGTNIAEVDNRAFAQRVITWLAGPPIHPADFDEDGDVDLDDFGFMQGCVSGSGVSPGDPACQDANLDGDTDVDDEDVLAFRGCLSGAGVEPSEGCLDP